MCGALDDDYYEYPEPELEFSWKVHEARRDQYKPCIRTKLTVCPDWRRGAASWGEGPLAVSDIRMALLEPIPKPAYEDHDHEDRGLRNSEMLKLVKSIEGQLTDSEEEQDDY